MSQEQYQAEVDGAKERTCKNKVKKKYAHCAKYSSTNLLIGKGVPDECYAIPACTTNAEQPAPKKKAKQPSLWE